MDTIKVTIGTKRTLQSGQPDDNLRPVKFEGEELANVTMYAGTDDTRGVTETLYRTEDGRLIVYVEDWTKWQGETTTRSLCEVTESDLKAGARFERLGFEAGFQEALTLQEALETA